ncbi:MAG: CehA/McbA family metallohydrolase [Limnochordia bacterium]|jgi:predicted metal-dependent phosphoesterase TrpH
MESVFRTTGRWLRGNLHTHTKESDGRVEVAEAINKYKEAGYDFLAVTDHRKTVDTTDFTTPGFLTIPSIELNGRDPQSNFIYHVVGIGVTPFEQEDREWIGLCQEMIDKVRAGGGVAILAHPYWSGNDVNDLMNLRDVCAMEVYNATCMRHGKERGEVYWDSLLERGKMIWGVAVDDTHHYDIDVAAGWVMVKAAELSTSAILAALQAGRFYATNGPAIVDIEYDAQEIRVHCSPVTQVRFIGRRGSGRSVIAQPGSEITAARVKLPRSPYVRVECVDRQGRTAWSQPIHIG